MRKTRSLPIAAALGLAMLASPPQAVSQVPPVALAVKQGIDRQGYGLLTDSFDSTDVWKSNLGQYDPTLYTGDHGDVMSTGGILSTLSVQNANIYGKLHTVPGGALMVGSQGGVGTHSWQAITPGTAQPGYLLYDANPTFPDTSLPYNSGLPLGGPQTIVIVTYDYVRTPTNSTVYPNPPPWSGVITNTLETSTTLPSPIPAGIITNTSSVKGTVEPAPGTYIPPYYKVGSWYYYQRIIGYSWPVLSYTWNLYATNAVYTTNTYDDVLTSGDYYALDTLHGSTIVLGNARLVVPAGLGMSGRDEITIGPNGKLQLFCGGNQCTVGGNGIINLAAYASNFLLECASTVTNLNFNSNGRFIGMILAPSADVNMNGAGTSNNDFIGSLAANSVRMNGRFSFHYDEALTRLQDLRARLSLPPRWSQPDIGHFQFSVSGISGCAYVVEASTNLVDWEPVITNMPPFVVVDENVTNQPRRFYRAVWKP